MTDMPLTPDREQKIRRNYASFDSDGTVNVLLAEIDRLRAEFAPYEMLAPQQCAAGKHADWLVDSEYAHACPWCRIAELEEARRLEWQMSQARNPHTPLLCACGHSHFAHTVPDPHSCFAFGQTCPCEAYRQLPHDEAVAQLKANQRAASERAKADLESASTEDAR